MNVFWWYHLFGQLLLLCIVSLVFHFGQLQQKRRLTNKACTIIRYTNLALDSSLMFVPLSFFRKCFLWKKQIMSTFDSTNTAGVCILEVTWVAYYPDFSTDGFYEFEALQIHVTFPSTSSPSSFTHWSIRSYSFYISTF